MSQLRETIQTLIRNFDNESSFVTLAAAATIPHLEVPLNRARFFDYDKDLELYFDSKDLNRFSRLQKLTKIIAKRIKAKPVKGFERNLKQFREQNVMIREKEGPSEGMAWQGFGGVHSHYTLTPLGETLLIFQATLRTSILDFRKIAFSENWDAIVEQEVKQITSAIADKKMRIRERENIFYTKREETSVITQRLFELFASNPKKISQEEINDFIWNKAGEIHLGEIPKALENLKPLLQRSGDSYTLNDRGKLARIGYGNLIVEGALTLEDTEIVHYMVSAKNILEGSIKIIKQYSLWF